MPNRINLPDELVIGLAVYAVRVRIACSIVPGLPDCVPGLTTPDSGLPDCVIGLKYEHKMICNHELNFCLSFLMK